MCTFYSVLQFLYKYFYNVCLQNVDAALLCFHSCRFVSSSYRNVPTVGNCVFVSNKWKSIRINNKDGRTYNMNMLKKQQKNNNNVLLCRNTLVINKYVDIIQVFLLRLAKKERKKTLTKCKVILKNQQFFF